MKKILAILSLCLLAFPSLLPAQTYFCLQEGTKLSYRRTYVESGKFRNRSVWTIGKPSDKGSVKDIPFTIEYFKENGKALYSAPMKLEAEVKPNGDLVLDLSATAASAMKSMFPKASPKAEKCSSLLPHGMKPGDSLPSTHLEVGLLGTKYIMNVDERKVLRREKVTVPAGTFSCVVVSEHKVEKASAYNRETVGVTWYADGIGMVRHDTYKNGSVETREVLMSIEK